MERHGIAGEVLPPRDSSDGPLVSTRAAIWAARTSARQQQLCDNYVQTPDPVPSFRAQNVLRLQPVVLSGSLSEAIGQPIRVPTGKHAHACQATRFSPQHTWSSAAERRK